MPSVTVWLFPTAFGAETGEAHLTGLVERGALVVHDAAAISWVPSDPEPRVRQLKHLTARAAGKGAMLGTAVGLLLRRWTPAAGLVGDAGHMGVSDREHGDTGGALRRSGGVGPGQPAPTG